MCLKSLYEVPIPRRNGLTLKPSTYHRNHPFPHHYNTKTTMETLNTNNYNTHNNTI